MIKSLMAPYVTPLLPLPTSVRYQNNLKSPILAVLFDIYGTLFISASGDISNAKTNLKQTSAINSLIGKYNISLNHEQLNEKLVEAIKSDHFISKKNGIDFPEIIIEQIFMNILQLKDLKIARMFAVEYEMIVNPVYPMPHLRSMLQQLESTNIPMGIISNAQFFTPYLFDFFCGAFPENLGFNANLIFYSFDLRCAKPSRVLFKQAADALNTLNITPDNVLYVGNDMLNDIYGANDIGFQTCLFAGDNRSLRLRADRPECVSLKPDATIKELNQLTDMIRLS